MARLVQNRPGEPVTRALIEQLYVVERRTIRGVAQALGAASAGTARHYLKKFDIALRHEMGPQRKLAADGRVKCKLCRRNHVESGAVNCAECTALREEKLVEFKGKNRCTNCFAFPAVAHTHCATCAKTPEAVLFSAAACAVISMLYVELTDREIGAIFGVCAEMIRARRKKFGIPTIRRITLREKLGGADFAALCNAKSDREVAIMLSCKPDSVLARRARLGIKGRRDRNKLKWRGELTPSQLRFYYLELGWSDFEIGLEFDLERSTIKNRRHALGIFPFRPPTVASAAARRKVAAKSQSRRELLKLAPGKHSRAEWKQKLVEYAHCCAYCQRILIRPTKDHIVALANGGSDSIENIVPACRRCNSSKGKATWLPARVAQNV